MANPNPSPETRFKPGQSGNPSGRSSEELRNMNEAARIASELTLKALSSLQERIGEAEAAQEIAALLLDKEVRGMIIEAQNRAHGTPKQAMDVTTAGEPMTFTAIALAPLEADDETEH